MKIALLQMDIAWENPGTNHRRAEAFLQEASAGGADIAVLPEMFATGFSFDLQGLEAPDNHPTHRFLSGAAQKYALNIIAGFKALTPEGSTARNLARAYGRGGSTVATYAKLHPFTFSGEHEAITPGEGPISFSLEGLDAGMFICYDLRFPEDFRKIARKATVIFVLANWPASRAEHWEALLKARAIENQCFIAGVNRTGTDANGIVYAGGSMVFGPSGELLAQGGTGEEVLYATVEPQTALDVRARFPFLDDMRL